MIHIVDRIPPDRLHRLGLRILIPNTNKTKSNIYNQEDYVWYNENTNDNQINILSALVAEIMIEFPMLVTNCFSKMKVALLG